jgi:hypothetical protein
VTTLSGAWKPFGSSIANGRLGRCSVSNSVIAGLTPAAVSPRQIGGNSLKAEPSRSRCSYFAELADFRPLAPGNELYRYRAPILLKNNDDIFNPGNSRSGGLTPRNRRTAAISLREHPFIILSLTTVDEVCLSENLRT